jgi:hypothetical protein
MQPQDTHLHPRTAELHRSRPSHEVREFAREHRKTEWLTWQVEVLSEACSKRYCSDGEELKILETVRDAFSQALDKREGRETPRRDTDVQSAIGDH